ncbi:hypothetical protein N9H16_03465 [Candidatus Pelagibacter ubique]|nr:hypothetical protein [Candidatus Pelagibacter ubique]
MKIYLKIIKIIIFLNFVFIGKSFSDTESFTPSAYKITTYTLQFCETGSTLTTCLNPFTVNAIDAGSQMDLGGVEAGQQAGSFGNLSLVPPGTVYTHGQVIMDRKIILSGFGSACETGGTAGSKAAYGTSVTKTSPPTPIEQDIFIVTNTTDRTSASTSIYDTSANGTTLKDGTGTDSGPGLYHVDDNFVKVRWVFSSPLVIKDPSKLPTVEIAFTVEDAAQMDNTDCGASIHPNPVTITNSFKF